MCQELIFIQGVDKSYAVDGELLEIRSSTAGEDIYKGVEYVVNKNPLMDKEKLMKPSIVKI